MLVSSKFSPELNGIMALRHLPSTCSSSAYDTLHLCVMPGLAEVLHMPWPGQQAMCTAVLPPVPGCVRRLAASGRGLHLGHAFGTKAAGTCPPFWLSWTFWDNHHLGCVPLSILACCHVIAGAGQRQSWLPTVCSRQAAVNATLSGCQGAAVAADPLDRASAADLLPMRREQAAKLAQHLEAGDEPAARQLLDAEPKLAHLRNPGTGLPPLHTALHLVRPGLIVRSSGGCKSWRAFARCMADRSLTTQQLGQEVAGSCSLGQLQPLACCVCCSQTWRRTVHALQALCGRGRKHGRARPCCAAYRAAWTPCASCSPSPACPCRRTGALFAALATGLHRSLHSARHLPQRAQCLSEPHILLPLAQWKHVCKPAAPRHLHLQEAKDCTGRLLGRAQGPAERRGQERPRRSPEGGRRAQLQPRWAPGLARWHRPSLRHLTWLPCGGRLWPGQGPGLAGQGRQGRPGRQAGGPGPVAAERAQAAASALARRRRGRPCATCTAWRGLTAGQRRGRRCRRGRARAPWSGRAGRPACCATSGPADGAGLGPSPGTWMLRSPGDKSSRPGCHGCSSWAAAQAMQ